MKNKKKKKKSRKQTQVHAPKVLIASLHPLNFISSSLLLFLNSLLFFTRSFQQRDGDKIFVAVLPYTRSSRVPSHPFPVGCASVSLSLRPGGVLSLARTISFPFHAHALILLSSSFILRYSRSGPAPSSRAQTAHTYYPPPSFSPALASSLSFANSSPFCSTLAVPPLPGSL